VLAERAVLQDWAGVTALLAASGLPLSGLEDQFPEVYVVARKAGRVLGVSGLQHHGGFGLLRSVAVDSGHRGLGIGRMLVSDCLATAFAAGVENVYLLTEGAANWFRGFGFERVTREEAPTELMASPEFVDACPASAVCMVARQSALQDFLSK
jgi:N-acetylglutamate synthase-like GNAT family acetyltransferase